MTVAARSPSIDYNENGVTLSFAAPFRFTPGTIAVSRVTPGGAVIDLVPGLDFTTGGGGTDAGGTVLLADSIAGARLRIRRATPRSQPMDYTPGDRFPAESHEAALDRQALIAQEQDAAIEDTATRALKVPDGETAGALPPIADRAGKFFAFDVQGRPFVTPGIAGPVGNTGPQGPRGLTGATGERGPIGNIGPAGNAGPQGVKGDTGAQGLQGPVGAPGDAGAQGAKGDTGGQGPQGPIGAQGVKGDTGAQGSQGPAGPTPPVATSDEMAAGLDNAKLMTPLRVRQAVYLWSNYIDVGYFGVVGDGVADDTLAMRNVANWVNAQTDGAALAINRRRIKISGDVTFSKAVSFLGGGQLNSIITCYNNARIICDGQRTTQPEFSFEKLSIQTDGIHTGAPLRVDYSPHLDGRLTPTFTMRDCVISGRNDTSGFYAGITLVDCPWPKLDNVVIVGDYGRGGGALSTYGIEYLGGDGSASFDKLRCYFMEEAVHIEGSMEGVQFSDCEIVAVQRGITYRATLGGAEPYVVISRSHINAEECSVRFDGVNQFHIGNGSLFYAQGFRGLSLQTAIVSITPSEFSGTPNQLPVSGSFSGLTLFGSSKLDCVGIHILGTSSSLEEYTITNVRFEAMGYGIYLDPQTNGVFVDANVTFRNVNVPVTDLGGAGLNIREPKVVQGTVVASTNSAGQIVVNFGTTPTGDKFFSPPIVVVNGANGGVETFTVVDESTTTRGCTVQVANASGPLAAGITRRINFIAAGN